MALLIVGFVLASGCLGGTSTDESPTTTPHSTSSTTPTVPSSSPTHITTTSTSPATSSSTTVTSPTTSSPSTTTTTTTTSTQAPAEEAYWSHPWEYAPVEIGDAMYTITYYRYAYKVRPNQTSPVYEYILEKRVEKTKIHVYGQDMRLNKIDLGEHEVHAYETVVTPVKAVSMNSKLVITIWYVSNKSNAFLYPWDVSWFAMISPYTQNTEFVGMEFEYKGEKFLFMNPAPFQSGLLPYFEGNDELLGSLNEDLTNIYMGWVSVLHLAVWSAIAEENLMSPYQGTWSDMQGHTWRYSIKPDGMVSIGGFDFKTADVEWSYAGVPENVTLSGSGKVSPSLPIPILVEGSFSYKENNRWRTVYAYLELKDLRLEKVKG